jgi:hypothetical protein
MHYYTLQLFEIHFIAQQQFKRTKCTVTQLKGMDLENSLKLDKHREKYILISTPVYKAAQYEK